MASVTDPIVGGGGSIFAPPPITPQPVGKINNGSIVSAAASSKDTVVDTLSISDLAKSLAAANKASKDTTAV